MTDKRFNEIFEAIDTVRWSVDLLKDIIYPDDDLIYELFDEICRLRGDIHALNIRFEAENKS